MPALPLHEAGKYVAGAYLVFLVLLLVYVSIMAARLQRVDRELEALADLAEGRQRSASESAPEPGDTGREAEDVAGVAR
jgi:hypothetical protein